MRARNIKPGFFKNDLLAECEPLARILFSGLWCMADREGRLEDRPKRIKAEILPYDECDVDGLLIQLEQHGFILRYAASEDRFIQVCGFCKHQHPHVNEAPSTIPAPDDTRAARDIAQPDTVSVPEEYGAGSDSARDMYHASTVQAPESYGTNPSDPLTTDSLTPDTLAAPKVAAVVAKPKPVPRRDQAMHEALELAFKFGPASDTERGTWNAANKQLREAGVDPSEIPLLKRSYAKVYPRATCTPMALAAHVGQLRAAMNGAEPDEEFPHQNVTGIAERNAERRAERERQRASAANGSGDIRRMESASYDAD